MALSIRCRLLGIQFLPPIFQFPAGMPAPDRYNKLASIFPWVTSRRGGDPEQFWTDLETVGLDGNKGFVQSISWSCLAVMILNPHSGVLSLYLAVYFSGPASLAVPSSLAAVILISASGGQSPTHQTVSSQIIIRWTDSQAHTGQHSFYTDTFFLIKTVLKR